MNHGLNRVPYVLALNFLLRSGLRQGRTFHTRTLCCWFKANHPILNLFCSVIFFSDEEEEHNFVKFLDDTNFEELYCHPLDAFEVRYTRCGHVCGMVRELSLSLWFLTILKRIDDKGAV